MSIRDRVLKQRVLRIGPGTALKRFFEKFGIQQKKTGCKCADIMAYMNKIGPDQCLKEINSLVDKIGESIVEWKEGSRIIPTPPRLLIKLSVIYAIKISRESQPVGVEKSDTFSVGSS